MVIASIGAIGFLYCIFIMPFTNFAKNKIKEHNSYELMYIYVFFMMLTIIGFMLGI